MEPTPPTTGDPPAEPQPPPSRPRALERLWREWVRPLLVVLVVMTSLRSAVADWNDVPTGSMKPTIVEGDRIFVNKAAYDLRLPFTRVRLLEWSEPQRGDIVVLFSPDEGKRLVKRVVGLPGDEVELERGRLLINGEPAQYAPLEPEATTVLDPEERSAYRFASEEIGGQEHPVMLAPWIGTDGYFGPVTVPEDRYFVMGDNRSHSRDSRVFGFVPRAEIVGRATAVVLSVDKDNHYLPRWGRFFLRLR